MSQPTSLVDRIHRDFTYHAPQPDQQPKYAEIRDTAKAFALRLVELVPEGRELHRALSALEDVVFNANAGIARNGPSVVFVDRSTELKPSDLLKPGSL